METVNEQTKLFGVWKKMIQGVCSGLYLGFVVVRGGGGGKSATH